MAIGIPGGLDPGSFRPFRKPQRDIFDDLINRTKMPFYTIQGAAGAGSGIPPRWQVKVSGPILPRGYGLLFGIIGIILN